MRLSHPFVDLPASARRRSLPLLIVLTLALTAALQVVVLPEATQAAE